MEELVKILMAHPEWTVTLGVEVSPIGKCLRIDVTDDRQQYRGYCDLQKLVVNDDWGMLYHAVFAIAKKAESELQRPIESRNQT